MKLVMTLAMLLGTSALFAQQHDVKAQLKAKTIEEPVRAVAISTEMRKVVGVVHLDSGARKMYIAVKQNDGVLNFVPVNLPKKMYKEGLVIKFNYHRLEDRKISLRNITVL